MSEYLRVSLKLTCLIVCGAALSAAQAAKTPSSVPPSSAEQAVKLAKSGRCHEAIPQLKRALAQTQNRELRKDAAFAGVRCAMVSSDLASAEDFLRVLNREFPDDPEVLYTTVHTYSDLATRASQKLATTAPNSPQAHELKAESLEMNGKWPQAAKEYEKVALENPRLPGIHFRLGRLLLSEPNPPADAAEQAKKEFEQELEIDPSNTGAEYVLGELAREGQHWDEALEHFSRAVKLDPQFGDAFLGLGLTLIATRKFSDAVAPLETAVKLEPANPAAHYNLAMAYTRTGRKQEGEREFQIHREMVENKHPSGDQPAEQPSASPQ